MGNPTPLAGELVRGPGESGSLCIVGDPIVETAVALPAPRLRALVDYYVGYRLEGFSPGLHQGLPSRNLTMIISLASPVDVAVMPDPARPPGAFPALVAGLHAAPATIAHDGRQHGVHVKLNPLGARALLGVPAGELASAVIDLRDLSSARAAELPDRLASTAGWPGRFAVLDDVLSRWLADMSGPPPAVAWAWGRLVASGGSVGVQALAEEVGWSRRHLGERFRTELGLSPKLAARVLRFERACRRLKRPRRPSLADVALACGYYDQAHLTRDWTVLAGCTPTAWMSEELPFVQDETEDAVPI